MFTWPLAIHFSSVRLCSVRSSSVPCPFVFRWRPFVVRLTSVICPLVLSGSVWPWVLDVRLLSVREDNSPTDTNGWNKFCNFLSVTHPLALSGNVWPHHKGHIDLALFLHKYPWNFQWLILAKTISYQNWYLTYWGEQRYVRFTYISLMLLKTAHEPITSAQRIHKNCPDIK